MPPIRMLALDLDGTLAVQGDEVSPATAEALSLATERGVEVVIATSRRYRSACRVVDRLPLAPPVLCHGGALLKSETRETLFAETIAVDDLRRIASVFVECGLVLMAQREPQASGGSEFVVDTSVQWTGFVASYLDRVRNQVDTLPSIADAPPGDVLVATCFGGEREPMLQAQAALEARHPGRFRATVIPTPGGRGSYLEVFPAGRSKWSGLQRLAALRGLPHGAICAVGDQLNDMPMVVGSGMGVAMGNGHEALKQAADWVCGRNDEDGIVEVVEHIIGLS